MQRFSQSGFIHLFLIILLLAGIAVGVFLVQQKTHLFSKASDESIDSLTARLSQLNQPQQSAQDTSEKNVGQMIAIASQRKEKLLELIEKDPQSFIRTATLVDSLNTFPKEVQPYLEQEKEITGTITIWHTDNFQQNGSSDTYRLDAGDNKSYDLYFDNAGKSLKIGSRILVKGIVLDSKIAIRSKDDLQEQTPNRSSQSVLPPVVGEHKVIALLVKFQNMTSEPITTDEVNNLLFGESGSARKYYLDSSYGQLNLTGKVAGYFEIPYKNTTDKDHLCDNLLGDWMEAANQEALKQGIDVSQYPHHVYFFSGNPVCTISLAGGSIGRDPSLTVVVNSLAAHNSYVYIHELGHNLGINHANFLDCKDKAIDNYNNCYHTDMKSKQGSEGSDRFDVMGFAEGMKQFNAPHKIAVGWIPPSRVQHITSDGDYTISEALDENKDGIQVLRLPKEDTNEYYFLSIRQDGGALPKGTHIHIWNEDPTVQTKAITPHPKVNFTQGAALQDGEVFYDQINHIAITQIKHTDTSATLNIKFSSAKPDTLGLGKLYRLVYYKDGTYQEYACPLDATKGMGVDLDPNNCHLIRTSNIGTDLQYTSEYVAQYKDQQYLFRLIYQKDGSYSELRCPLDWRLGIGFNEQACQTIRSLNIGINLQHTSEYIAGGKFYRLIYNKDGSFTQQHCALDTNAEMGVAFNSCTEFHSIKADPDIQYTSEYLTAYEYPTNHFRSDRLFRMIYKKDGSYSEYRCGENIQTPLGEDIEPSKCIQIRSMNIGTNLQYTSEYIAP